MDTRQRWGRRASLERKHFYCWPGFNISPNNNLFNLFLSIIATGRWRLGYVRVWQRLVWMWYDDNYKSERDDRWRGTLKVQQVSVLVLRCCQISPSESEAVGVGEKGEKHKRPSKMRRESADTVRESWSLLANSSSVLWGHGAPGGGGQWPITPHLWPANQHLELRYFLPAFSCNILSL